MYCENDQHNKLLTSTLSHSYIFFFFWLVLGTFKMDSFSNFQIYKILYILAIALLAIDMMYIISPGLIYLITVSLTTFTQFFQPDSPWMGKRVAETLVSGGLMGAEDMRP